MCTYLTSPHQNLEQFSPLCRMFQREARVPQVRVRRRSPQVQEGGGAVHQEDCRHTVQHARLLQALSQRGRGILWLGRQVESLALSCCCVLDTLAGSQVNTNRSAARCNITYVHLCK